MPPILHDAYRFDEFELSRSRRTLLRNGQQVSLLPKTFEVLSYLVENPGRVVSKEELLKTAWPESFVEENNLTQHISLFRKALGDRSGFIVTIPGRGYQFTAEVTSGDALAKPSALRRLCERPPAKLSPPTMPPPPFASQFTAFRSGSRSPQRWLCCPPPA